MTLLDLWCIYMPWHKFRKIRISNNVDKLICRHCGREFGINYEVEVVLPWGLVNCDTI